MTKNRKRLLLGAVLELTGYFMLVYFYDWKLAVAAFALFWAHAIGTSERVKSMFDTFMAFLLTEGVFSHGHRD